MRPPERDNIIGGSAFVFGGTLVYDGPTDGPLGEGWLAVPSWPSAHPELGVTIRAICANAS